VGTDDSHSDDDDDGDEEDDDEIGESDAEEEERQDVVAQLQESQEEEDEYPVEVTRFESIQQSIDAAPSQEDMVAADDMDTGAPLPLSNLKRKNLLNKNVGLNDLNMGRSAYMSGVLFPYKILIEGLQVSCRPEQHKAARRIRSFYRQMTSGWIGTQDQPANMPGRLWIDWKKDMIDKGKDELVNLLIKECNSFSAVIVQSLKLRLKPYWNHIQSLELIDPAGPALETYTTDDVWEAAEDLCERRGIDYTNLRTEIIQLRSEFPDLDTVTKAQIHADLIQYYRLRKDAQVLTLTGSPTKCLDEFAIAVFSTAIVSSFVESLFSKMNYNQNKSRMRLKDHTTSSILHVHDLVVSNPLKPIDGDFRLKCNDENNITISTKHKKHVGKTVCCMFVVEGRNDGEMKRYHGKVTRVEYNETYAEWMYHVVYPQSEGHEKDEVDYWRDEITPLWCTCDPPVHVQVDVDE